MIKYVYFESNFKKLLIFFVFRLNYINLLNLKKGYARKAGVYGGHYRLMSPLKEILYDENSCVRGAIFVEPETKKDYTVECNAIVVDPEMMPEKCIKTGDIISAIVITK